MPGANIHDGDLILYGERPELPRQAADFPYDWSTYPLLKDTRKLGLDEYAFRNWSYAGIGSCWCGGNNWAVNLGTAAADDCAELFPGSTIFEVEGADVSFEDEPTWFLRSAINTAIRSHDKALACELSLHHPDEPSADGAVGQDGHPDVRVEVRYQMQGREYVDQASLAVVQTIEALKPKHASLIWRYLPGEAKLVAYDARHDQLLGLTTTRALQPSA